MGCSPRKIFGTILEIDWRTRKLMTIHKTLQPRDYVNRLYMSSKERGKRLTSTEDSVDASIERLVDYIQKRGERLVIATQKKKKLTA